MGGGYLEKGVITLTVVAGHSVSQALRQGQYPSHLAKGSRIQSLHLRVGRCRQRSPYPVCAEEVVCHRCLYLLY